MNRKPIFTALLICAALFAPLAVWGQDFVIEGKKLVRYRGIAENVSIPEGIDIIGSHAFAMNKELLGVVLPYSVTIISDHSFYGCNSLANILLSSSLIIIGNNAFSYCNNLMSITIPPNVYYIGDGAFGGCDKLLTVTVSRKTKIDKDAFPDGVRVVYSD